MPATLKRNRANHDFSRNPKIHLPRSVFKRPWKRLMTLDCSYLYPICVKLVNPGETWKIDMDIFARLTSQIVPVMDNLRIQTFFFFDPCRLLWEHFPELHGQKDNPDDNNSFIVPQIQLSSSSNYFSTIYDYMRAPMGVNKKINAMPFRMYNHVWNSYFRNEQIQDSVTFNKGDADDDPSIYQLLRINKRADFITTGLPSPQAGEPVQLPLGTTAPVVGDGYALGITDGTQNYGLYRQTGSTVALSGAVNALNKLPSEIVSTSGGNPVAGAPISVARTAENSHLVALLNEAAGASIQSLRQLIATQELLERDNRNGVRYTEILEGRYGVTNPDLLLYRPQYLGGTSQILGTTPVIQTSATNDVTPQANLAGYGVTGDSGRVVEASFGEWGYIMGLVCITSEPQYQYGCDKLYTMRDRFDFYYPEFNYIGDEATTNGQIFCQGDDVVDEEGNIIDNQPFNYTERNAYYKQNQNEICGRLRSNSVNSQGQSNTLQYWHYAETQTELPAFNSEYIQDKTYETVQRTIAVQTEPQIIMEADFDATVYSPIPEYNIPRISSIL